MKFEQFKAGVWRQQYQYKSFSPIPVNQAWTWEDPGVHTLLEQANRALGELNAFSLIVPDIDLFIETKDGPVIWEDHFYPEIIDPESGEVRPYDPSRGSEEGELVFTTLTKQALPVIRYRTRDLTRLLPPTARSMRRMGKIVGRSDDMLIIREINVIEPQVLLSRIAKGDPGPVPGRSNPHAIFPPSRQRLLSHDEPSAADDRPRRRHLPL